MSPAKEPRSGGKEKIARGRLVIPKGQVGTPENTNRLGKGAPPGDGKKTDSNDSDDKGREKR